MDTKNKVIILGKSGVGKTCLVQRLYRGIFLDDIDATIGSSYVLVNKIYNGEYIKMRIWDTAGQERYDSIIPLYIREANVCIICSDTYDIKNFQKYINIATNIEPDIKLYFVITKIDQYNKKKTSDHDNIVKLEDFVKNHNTKIYRTSAKDDIGISELFEDVGMWILEDKGVILYNTKNKDVILNNTKNYSRCC